MERYKLFEQLGAGGAGQVFKGYDKGLDRYVAMKRLFTHEESQRAESEEVKNEAASLARLRHPNIVSVYGVEGDETGTYIVMELLEGDDLAEWLQREGLLGVDDFKQLARQTLEALLAAHEQNILHRDLKPENIKVTRLRGGRFQAKIIDLGLARISLAARKQTQDQAGNVLGSVNYMAPEQLRREPLDARTDIYALGCVFYEALSGVKPFAGDSVQDTMNRHLKHRVELLHDRCPELPEMLNDWVMWLIAADRDERPRSAADALASLEEVYKRTDTGSVPTATSGVVVIPQPVYLAPSTQTSEVEIALSEEPSPLLLQGTADAQKREFPWPLIITGGIVAIIGAGVFLFTHQTLKAEKLDGIIIGSKGSYNNNGNDITMVFDGKTDTFFDGPKGDGMWAGLKLGNQTRARILCIRYYPRAEFPQRMVSGKFQASDDEDFIKGVVDLHTITAMPPVDWVEVPVDSVIPYRYVRYLAPDKSSGNVAEIEFHGVKE